MNKDNMLKLAAIIEPLENIDTCYGLRSKRQFAMNYITFDCGTPACIAGWAASCSVDREVLGGVQVVEEAAKWLGVDRDWAHENLFFPTEHNAQLRWDGEVNYDNITAKVAAACLRELATFDALPTGDAMTAVWAEAFKEGELT